MLLSAEEEGLISADCDARESSSTVSKEDIPDTHKELSQSDASYTYSQCCRNRCGRS